MGKSSGSGGGRTGDVSPGRIQTIVAAAGGVLGGQFATNPMSFKSFDQTKLAFAGASAAQAEAISTGKRTVMQSVTQAAKAKLPPVRVSIHTDRKGKAHVTLHDGRHRSHQAAEAGARHIRAEVQVIGPRGGVISTRTMNLPLGKSKMRISDIEAAKSRGTR